jgi:guanine deaminase
MDRGAPAALLDTAETGYRESEALIGRWHDRGRLQYAISPRFAVTSSDAQLEAAGALLAAHSGCYLQTHLSENEDEIATVRRLFPWATSYTHVYDHFGLLGPRSLFGHCIHLDEGERERLSATRSIAALCPTSNLFLGSGLFDLAALRGGGRPVRLALATDIGGGTSYSMLRTAAEAYKVVQLRGQRWSALEAFYAITLGNARALGLEAAIGSLEPGTEADIVVLDARATPAMAHRMETARELAEELFVLLIMGDERVVRATYVMGERVARA